MASQSFKTNSFQSRKTHPLFIAGALAILLISSSMGTAIAQRRIDSIPTTKGCYRQPVTPISQVPTFHSDMPLDCILGYIYFDSLCRGLQSDQQADSLISSIQSWDTMRVFMRFMYKMAEYDADLYSEYLFGSRSISPRYNINPERVHFDFIPQMQNMLGEKNKLVYLAVVPLIVRIHVVDVQNDNDSLILPYPLKCIRAIVIDTIKGMHLRPGDPVNGYVAGENRKGATPQAGYSWIDISYSPNTPKSYSGIARGRDMGRCDSCYGTNALTPGNDYIVFLENLYLDYNGTHTFYEYLPYATYNGEGGIFPIDSNGNVLSQDNYFGYGTAVPLQNFETLLRTDIQSIVSH